MGKSRVDRVWDQYYAPHLGMKNNPSNNVQELTRIMYIRELTEFACNRFKWEGLPDTVDARFLELTLFRRAMAVFFKEKDLDAYLALPAAGSGEVNMYYNPKTVTVTSPGINATLRAVDGKGKGSRAECVPIWANYLRVPDLDVVELYSNRLAKIDRTIDINIDNMRYTKMIAVDENERLSWTNLLRQHDEGQPLIMGAKGLIDSMSEKLAVFDVGAPTDALPKLLTARHQLWNQCMTLLGINNANQEKKERMVADEVGANDDQVISARAVALNARRQACDAINDLFGLSVSVDYVNPMPTGNDPGQGSDTDEESEAAA